MMGRREKRRKFSQRLESAHLEILLVLVSPERQESLFFREVRRLDRLAARLVPAILFHTTEHTEVDTVVN